MRKIYQFIIRWPEQVMTVSAESADEALVHAQYNLRDKKCKLELVGVFGSDEFGKLLKISTVLVEPLKIESLGAMAEMLRNNGYAVHAKSNQVGSPDVGGQWPIA